MSRGGGFDGIICAGDEARDFQKGVREGLRWREPVELPWHCHRWAVLPGDGYRDTTHFCWEARHRVVEAFLANDCPYSRKNGILVCAKGDIRKGGRHGGLLAGFNGR